MMKRYKLTVVFDQADKGEPLDVQEEESLRMWLQGTLDNAPYDEDVGFPSRKITEGYVE